MAEILPLWRDIEDQERQLCGVCMDPRKFLPLYLKRFLQRLELEGKLPTAGNYGVEFKVILQSQVQDDTFKEVKQGPFNFHHHYLLSLSTFSSSMSWEAFQSKKRGNLGNGPNRGGVVKKSKKSQISVGKSSKLGGGSSEIKKVPSFRGYQRLIK